MYGWFSKVYVFSFFWAGWGLWVKAERKKEGESKSHFLMLSRRAAVLYCVAWGLFSLANLSMLQWPAWLWPPDALYRATTKAGECCLSPSLCPPHCSTLHYVPQTPLPLLHTLAYTQAGRQARRQASLLWAPGRRVSLTERDRRQSLINHVYAAGAQNII